MADEWITVQNPDLDDAPHARVTREAYEQTWRAKGFKEVDVVDAHISTLLNRPVEDATKLGKDDLVQAAALAGVAVEPSATKSDILLSLTEALNPQEDVING